jgi:glycosyltransferase involved in cell wall biosynthesis
MTSPLVSMIVTAHNRASLLPTALDSVLSQDYEPLELIAIDDGSDDETAAVLAEYGERYPEERFRWVSQENAGQPRSINRGVELARGEIVGLLSDDDWLLPGAVRLLVDRITRAPEADVVYGGFYLVEDGQIVDTVKASEHNFLEMLRAQEFSIGPGALLRRPLFERTGGWNPAFQISPDFEFYLRAGPQTRYGCIDRVVSANRRHAQQISTVEIGISMVHERIAILDSVFADPQLAPEAREVRNEVYGTMLLWAGMVMSGDSLNAPDSRFLLDDRRLPQRLRSAEWRLAAEGSRSSFQLAAMQRQLDAHIEIIDELRAQVRAYDAAVAELRQALEPPVPTSPPASNGRPSDIQLPAWWSTLRSLTPPSLRSPIGTWAHRALKSRIQGRQGR